MVISADSIYEEGSFLRFASGRIGDAGNHPYDVPTSDAAATAVTADVAAAPGNDAIPSNDTTGHAAAESDDGSAATRHADDDLCKGHFAR